MAYFLNLLYLVALLLGSPWLLYKALTTGKYRRGLWCKLTGSVRPPRGLLSQAADGSAPVAWFHGVSVGEIHLLRQLVARFRERHPDWTCVVSTTTDTGFEEARKHFPDLCVFYWPFDFTWAVRRALRRIHPALVLLAEGELWPNFVACAQRRGIPMAVVNGRMSPRSFQRYRRFGWLSRWLLEPLDLVAVQTEEHAACFRALGARADRTHVTGSIKYDGVAGARDNPRTNALRQQLGIKEDQLIWIAGSTQPPEEEIVLQIYRRLRGEVANLRLFLVPRQPERFNQVARLLREAGEPFVRRSEMAASLAARAPIMLVDTIGELGALWGLADVAFVGGSLDGRRGGQNMIEPAAYGAAVVFGPYVWNFHDTATRLVAAGAAIQVADGLELEAAIRRLLLDASLRQRLGLAACRLVQSQQGATARTLDLIDRFLLGADRPRRAA